jgi:hypothetical protein
MRVYTWRKSHHNKAKGSYYGIAGKPERHYVNRQCTDKEEYMRNQVPHLVNFAGIGKLKPFLKKYERQFKTCTVLPERIFKKRLVARCDIVIGKRTYFPLVQLIPAYTIIFIGKEGNNKR